MVLAVAGILMSCAPASSGGEEETASTVQPSSGSVLKAQAEPDRAIQLHVDLLVDPSQEEELVKNYHRVFQPTILQQPGFVEVELLKFREAVAGPEPANSKYRLIISFETEEQRKEWVARDEHQDAWPTIDKTLIGDKYTALLYDVSFAP